MPLQRTPHAARAHTPHARRAAGAPTRRWNRCPTPPPPMRRKLRGPFWRRCSGTAAHDHLLLAPPWGLRA